MRTSIVTYATGLICLLSVLSGCSKDHTEPPPDVSQQQPEPQQPVPSEPMTSAGELPGTMHNNPAPPGSELLRIDLSGMVRAGLLEMQSNDPNWIRLGFRRATDGDTGSLKRTNRVDPLIVTLIFDSPVNLKSVRIFPSHAPRYDWSLLLGPDDARYSLVEAPGEAWSRMDLPTAVSTQRVTFEIARPGPDDFVHVNEVELYEPADAALAPPSESLPAATGP